jgi:hypothetical protein
MSFYNVHTIREEVREVLDSIKVNSLVSDAQIDRVIIKNAWPESIYTFEKITDGVWSYRGSRTYDFFLNPTFDGIDGGVYDVNSSGSIVKTEDYDIAIVDVADTPSPAFVVSGDWVTSFTAGSVFSVNGSVNENDEYTEIDNSGSYTVLSSSYDLGDDETTIVVAAITSQTVEGLITFTPVFTDDRSIINVTGALVDFAEVMFTILTYIATSKSHRDIQQLMGAGVIGGRDAVSVLLDMARKWRGIWSC